MACEIVADIRKYKSDKGVSLGSELESVVLSVNPEYAGLLEKIKTDIAGTGKIKNLEIAQSEDVERFAMRFE